MKIRHRKIREQDFLNYREHVFKRFDLGLFGSEDLFISEVLYDLYSLELNSSVFY